MHLASNLLVKHCQREWESMRTWTCIIQILRYRGSKVWSVRVMIIFLALPHINTSCFCSSPPFVFLEFLAKHLSHPSSDVLITSCASFIKSDIKTREQEKEFDVWYLNWIPTNLPPSSQAYISTTISYPKYIYTNGPIQFLPQILKFYPSSRYHTYPS